MNKLRRIVKYFILECSHFFNNDLNSKIIYYHDIHVDKPYTSMSTPFEVFKSHLKIMKDDGFEVVDKITQTRGQVMICFDDGWRGIYDIKDYLVTNHVPVTVFIAVSLIGKDGYLNVDEIKSLKQKGFNFECHSWSHTNLAMFNDDELEREIKASRYHLENQLGFTINDICFPQGLYSDKVVDYSKRCGYKKLFSSVPGDYYDEIEPDVLRRNLVQFAGKREFKLILHGASKMFSTRILKKHKI